MMMVIRWLLLSYLIFLLSGCAETGSKIKSLDGASVYLADYDASRRGELLTIQYGDKQTTRIRSCSEPAPDVALSFLNAIKGSLQLPNGPNGNIDTSFNTTALELAGRDELVLLAREALFRICEASINNTIHDRDVKELFKEVFFNVTRIAELQAEKAKSVAETAKAEAEKAKLQVKAADITEPAK